MDLVKREKNGLNGFEDGKEGCFSVNTGSEIEGQNSALEN